MANIHRGTTQHTYKQSIGNKSLQLFSQKIEDCSTTTDHVANRNPSGCEKRCPKDLKSYLSSSSYPFPVYLEFSQGVLIEARSRGRSELVHIGFDSRSLRVKLHVLLLAVWGASLVL